MSVFSSPGPTPHNHRILAHDGRELIAFRQELDGIKSVRAPLLHLPAAARLVFPQCPGSPLAQTKIHLGLLHLLTGQSAVEDVVEFLIRGFAVLPLRSDQAEGTGRWPALAC